MSHKLWPIRGQIDQVSLEIFKRGAILIASIEGANNFFEEFDKDFFATNSGFSYGSFNL